MFSFAVIVFREVVEIALVLSILLVATKGLPGRGRWIWLGLFLGALGSGAVAYFTDQISEAAEGMGQEIFNATVLLLAAALIGFTVIWMSSHGRQMSAQLKQVGAAVREGSRPLYVLTTVVGLAMLREGSEVALLAHGVLAGGQSVMSLLMGGLLGLLLGTGVGLAIYLGFIGAGTRYVFRISSFLLIALSAGMVSQALGYLAAADVLPTLVAPVWDTSAFVSEQSIVGQTLHALVGYTARPSAVQILGYLLTCGLLIAALQFGGSDRQRLLKQLSAAAMVLALFFGVVSQAEAVERSTTAADR